MNLPDGYRLPEGATMADARRLDQELLTSEGPEGRGPVKGDPEKASSEEV
jgi:hypothetical protein